jgi:hypothetical protein
MAVFREAEVLIETEAISLRYYPATKIVHHELRRFVHGEEFRRVLEEGLRVLIKHSAHKWLSDDRGNGALKPSDSEWALSEWAPRVIAAGWKYWAVVLPEKVLGQMNMRRFLETYESQGVHAMAFTNPRQALIWLEAQGK